MTKKVGRDTLKKLVEGVLSEREMTWPPPAKDFPIGDTFSSVKNTFPGTGKSDLNPNARDAPAKLAALDGDDDNISKEDWNAHFSKVINFDIDVLDSKEDASEDIIDITKRLRTLSQWSKESNSQEVKNYAEQILNSFVAKYPQNSYDASKNSQVILKYFAKGTGANEWNTSINLPLAKPIANNAELTVDLGDFVFAWDTTMASQSLPTFLDISKGKQPLSKDKERQGLFNSILEDLSPTYLSTNKGKEYGGAAITGVLLAEVIKNPSYYRNRSLLLHQLLRKTVDLHQEANANFSGLKLIEDLSKVLKEAPSTTDISDTTLGMDSPVPQMPVTSFMAEEGYALKTSSLLLNIFEESFDASTVQEKVGKLEAFSNQFNSGALTGTYQEQLSNMIILDFFRKLVQDYDASSAGFLFESFCAFLFSGTKLGGNTRLEDFEIGGKLSGTSPTPVTLKLYKEGSSETSSALSTYEKFFKQNPGGKITSISGIKGEGEISVTFYLKEITEDMFNTIVSTGFTPGKNTTSFKNGLRRYKPETSDAEKIGVSINSSTNLGTINFGFLSVEEDRFNEQAEKAFTGAAQQIGQMFKFYNNFKINATRYLTDKDQDINEAAKAIDMFNEMREKAINIFNPESEDALETSEPIKGSTVSQRIKESKEQKITSSMLKKIIEEKFKK